MDKLSFLVEEKQQKEKLKLKGKRINKIGKFWKKSVWGETRYLISDIKTMMAMSREYWDHSTPSFLLHETYPINWNTCWALSESSRQHSRKPLSTNLRWNRWSNPCVTWCQPGYRYRQWDWGPSRDLPHSPALIHKKSGVQGTEGNLLSLSSQCQSRKKVKPSFWDRPSLGPELL